MGSTISINLWDESEFILLIVTGNVLRCDVIVDAISEIEVITTTRELFLEDAPEMFSVQAKNDQGLALK